jgi:hypothetical protein
MGGRQYIVCVLIAWAVGFGCAIVSAGGAWRGLPRASPRDGLFPIGTLVRLNTKDSGRSQAVPTQEVGVDPLTYL